MTVALADLDALYASFAPTLDRLRVLARHDAFAEGAPEIPDAVVAARFSAIREEAAPLAAEIDGAMAEFARRLSAGEKAGRPATPGAQLIFAQGQRAAGAPYPLMANWPETRPATWAEAVKAAAQRRNAFVFWVGSVEDFRKRSLARIAKLGG